MAEVGRCRDCRWWKRVPRGEPVWHRSMGDCMTLPIDTLGFNVATADAPDGLDLRQLRIVTKPDFGCIQFEARADG